ncbi:hypothetical protein OG265_27490 [Streptomyces sp. NBC_01208]|uniref:hypothetical protein n=1 Tax=Streptomyces sp. NBC_01208 TaxID=2903773 RepID=UPI002E132ED7|nr:hypothetical protein OG265_27490 [Streptomyces sp. NBC_01208]
MPPRVPASLWSRLREDEWPTLAEMLRGGRPTVHGWVWAVLAFPCTWGLTLPLLVLYPLARSARIRARRLFPVSGHRHHEDPEVARAQRARAWIAVVVSVLVLVVYGEAEDLGQAQEQYFMRWAVTPWLLLVSGPVVVALVHRMASPQARERMRLPLRTARRSALWYVGALAVSPLAAVLVIATAPVVPEDLAMLFAPVTFLSFLLTTWVMLFMLFSTGRAVRSGFNSAQVHAALPALLTGVVVWEFAIVGLCTGGLPPGPPPVQVCVFLAGPLSVTALAWWEIDRLRTRRGVSLRD